MPAGTNFDISTGFVWDGVDLASGGRLYGALPRGRIGRRMRADKRWCMPNMDFPTATVRSRRDPLDAARIQPAVTCRPSLLTRAVDRLCRCDERAARP